MDRRAFLRGLPAPLLVPSLPAHAHSCHHPARVVWVQMTFSVGVRDLPGRPSVEECCAAQVARGRKVLATLYAEREFARIVVSQNCSSNEDANGFSARMLAMFDADCDAAEREYGAVESVTVVAENQCVDVFSIFGAYRTASLRLRVESLLSKVHGLEARMLEFERRHEIGKKTIEPYCKQALFVRTDLT